MMMVGKQQKIFLIEVVCPIVTGGTGLYLRWFIYGKPDVPKATSEISLEVQSELAGFERTYDWDAAVHLVTNAGDPTAQSLPANDWYRLRRKLEIIKVGFRFNFSKQIFLYYSFFCY
ncbi:putative tRNA dimethylallyltransferase [Helianthus debilis subsp. tardiflorus]